MENEIKKCGYRNCDNEIIGRRKDALYCSESCKLCEKVYRKRKRIKDEKNIEKNSKNI